MDSVPDEILLQIFESCDYYDIKISLAAVSKRFRKLINHRTRFGMLDRLLFRDEPKPVSLEVGRENSAVKAEPARITQARNKQELVGQAYKYHPAFDLIDYYNDSDGKDHVVWSVFLSYGDTNEPPREVPLSETSVARENAISPAVPKLILHLGIYDIEAYTVIHIGNDENDKGSAITVSRVMDAVTDYLKPRLDWVEADIFLDRMEVKYLDGDVHLFILTTAPFSPLYGKMSF